jgi:hypothetical protein
LDTLGKKENSIHLNIVYSAGQSGIMILMILGIGLTIINCSVTDCIHLGLEILFQKLLQFNISRKNYDTCEMSLHKDTNLLVTDLDVA